MAFTFKAFQIPKLHQRCWNTPRNCESMCYRNRFSPWNAPSTLLILDKLCCLPKPVFLSLSLRTLPTIWNLAGTNPWHGRSILHHMDLFTVFTSSVTPLCQYWCGSGPLLLRIIGLVLRCWRTIQRFRLCEFGPGSSKWRKAMNNRSIHQFRVPFWVDVSWRHLREYALFPALSSSSNARHRTHQWHQYKTWDSLFGHGSWHALA